MDLTSTLRHSTPVGYLPDLEHDLPDDLADLELSVDERAEARAMLDELARILHRTGRYNVSELARRMAFAGHPIHRRTLIRWFHGQTTPDCTDQVEILAAAAGVDLAYLGRW